MYLRHDDCAKPGARVAVAAALVVAIALVVAVFGYAGIADTPARHSIVGAAETDIIACPINLTESRKSPHPG